MEEKIELSWEELRIFYKVAYMDGFDGKNICGGLGRLGTHDVSDKRLSLAFVKFLQEKKIETAN